MNFDRLRELILEHAIQGKLVPQLESEPELAKNWGEPNCAPFDIPSKWAWVQVKFLEVKRKTVEPHLLTDDEVELWSIPSYDIGKAQVVSPSVIGSSKKLVFAGDVLLAKIVPHIKRAWVVSEENRESPRTKLASTEWLIYHSTLFLPDFLVLLFKSPYFRSKMAESVSGMGSLKRANPRAISKIWLPTPSKEEQARILTKINALSARIDVIERAHKELLVLCNLFRKQVLQKAIRGDLVLQLEGEQPPSLEGEMPEIVPFQIPEKWCWIRVKSLEIKRKTVDPTLIADDKVELWSIPAYDKGEAEVLPPLSIGSNKKVVFKGDVLLAKIVPHIERAWVVTENKSLNPLIKLASTEWLTYKSDLFLPDFLVLLFKSPYFRKNMLKSISGMGSLKRINPRLLSEVLLPLPPKEEQQRILRKVDSLTDRFRNW